MLIKPNLGLDLVPQVVDIKVHVDRSEMVNSARGIATAYVTIQEFFFLSYFVSFAWAWAWVWDRHGLRFYRMKNLWCLYRYRTTGWTSLKGLGHVTYSKAFVVDG